MQCTLLTCRKVPGMILRQFLRSDSTFILWILASLLLSFNMMLTLKVPTLAIFLHLNYLVYKEHTYILECTLEATP